MSKSYGNTILLTDPEPVIRAKLKPMVTDPARVRRTDPGNPDVCPVFDLHKVFSSAETQQKAREGCTTAGIGCIECKSWVADAIVAELAPIQERRSKFESNPERVTDILEDGPRRATAPRGADHARSPRSDGTWRVTAMTDEQTTPRRTGIVRASDTSSPGFAGPQFRKFRNRNSASAVRLRPKLVACSGGDENCRRTSVEESRRKKKSRSFPSPSPSARSTTGRSICCST